MDDLEEEITSHRKTLSLCPLDHSNRCICLDDLADAVLRRYEQYGKMEDLEEVITLYREVLTLCPLGHPDHPLSLSNLAIPILCRYEQSGSIEDLEEVITYNRQVLSLCPFGHPVYFTSLSNLSNALMYRYRHLGTVEDLEESITSTRQALTVCSSASNLPKCLINLTGALLTRYERSSRMEDLEEAITYNHILRPYPLDHLDRSICLSNFFSAAFCRYEQSGRTEDLEEAIAYNREALSLLPPGHIGSSKFLDSLGHFVLRRYEQSGRIEDLEEAIASGREALTFCPPGHPHPRYAPFLHNLGNSVFRRFVQSGRMKDLEEAITCNRQALALYPLDTPNRFKSLNSLANALLLRSLQLAKLQDLEEGIIYYRAALILCPLDDPNRLILLTNLAYAIFNRYEQSDKSEDLEEAITCNHQALTLHPLGHPARSRCLIHFSGAVLARFQKSGREEDLESAITYLREAIDCCPSDHPYRCTSLQKLANAIHCRYQQSHKMEDLEESLMICEQAVNASASPSIPRLSAAIYWADLARVYRRNSVIRAYSMSFRLLDHCLVSYPNIDLQQKFLAATPRSLASDAASTAIDATDIEAAVELLERGRAILWSKMGGYRSPLHQLRQVNKQLADRFETLSVELERLALSSSGSEPMESVLPSQLEAQMKRYRILSEEWEEVVGQIREIEGFTHFLQAVPFTTLQTAAAEGPIILINISKYRSDAIILHINHPPTLVTLPNAQPQYLAHLCKQLSDYVRDPGAFTDPSKIILPILRDLWDDIVSPVCECLTRLSVPHKSRVWWCPTSELCALPLHAAGPYLPHQRNLPDIYTSSYIPTVSALIRARSNMISQPVVPKLLLIGQPDEGLPNVQDEIDNVRQLGDFVDVIVGTDARHDTVLQGLREHSWAHFACHGHLGDNAQPFRASFQLYDDENRLTLLDLIQARLLNAELAFLSACHTAAGDLTTPDETIHLAAALQFCGFRSVVGTMWAMVDEDGPRIAKEFYKHMFRNPENKADFRDSAEALNVAIRAMRKNGVPLERWIMFVHIGA